MTSISFSFRRDYHGGWIVPAPFGGVGGGNNNNNNEPAIDNSGLLHRSDHPEVDSSHHYEPSQRQSYGLGGDIQFQGGGSGGATAIASTAKARKVWKACSTARSSTDPSLVKSK